MEESKLKFNVTSSFLKLKSYCESENFKGWDPYDGLNSKVFQALPIKHWDLARLAWIQGFKRCPINFRKLFLVPKEHNAKGVALFLSGYCNLYHIAETGNYNFGTKEEIKKQILDYYILHREGKLEVTPTNIEKYSRKNLTADMTDLFNEILQVK